MAGKGSKPKSQSQAYFGESHIYVLSPDFHIGRVTEQNILAFIFYVYKPDVFSS